MKKSTKIEENLPYLYEKLNENKLEMFNFYLRNNHQLNRISERDETELIELSNLILQRNKKAFAISLMSVFITDLVGRRLFFPKYKFGPLSRVLAYTLFPFGSVIFSSFYLNYPRKQRVLEITSSYNFDHNDFYEAIEKLREIKRKQQPENQLT